MSNHEQSLEYFRKHASVDKNTATLGQKDTLEFFNQNGVPDNVMKRVTEVQNELVTAAYAFTAEKLGEHIAELKKKGVSGKELESATFTTKCRIPDQTVEVTGCGMKVFRDPKDPKDPEKNIKKFFPTTAITRRGRQIDPDVVKDCTAAIQKLFS